MNIKKILVGAAAGVALIGTMAATVFAAAPWNVTGNYEVTFFLAPDTSTTPYVHHVTLSQTGSVVTGNGGYPATGGDVYHWNITSGSQTGDSINITALYDLGATGTTMHMVGAIASDGTVTGTWDDDFGGTRTGTWSITKGVSVPLITTPANGATVTSSALVKIDWTDSVGSNPPFMYQYQAFSDPGYTTLVYDSGMTLTASEIPTPGTPPGDYYVRVMAQNGASDQSAWSNGSTNPYVIHVTADSVLVGPPTNKDQCKNGGWKTFNNPTFKNQGQCEKYVKDHKENGKANGDIQMSGPSQRIKFSLSEKEVSDSINHKGKHNQVEYWNYDYPGLLHYKTDVLCVEVDKVTKEARFMFQIPSGWPGLTGLYVVAYLKDIEQKGVADLYGHAATSDLTTATAWCETGTGFSPTMYSVTKGKVEVK